MSPEQATTLLDWWQEQSIDGKSLFALSAEGTLTLKESSLYPSREIAQLNLQNLSVTVATLQKKFDEAQLKKDVQDQIDKVIPLIQEEYAGLEDEDGSVEIIIAKQLTKLGNTLAIAESCTGGAVAERFTAHSGASAFFKGGLVTYSTQSKINVLKVLSEELFKEKYSEDSDLIKFYFHDLVNNKYIPFRATVTGLNENLNADWTAIEYIGRADKLQSYKGFSRGLSFKFNVVANSIKELLPMVSPVDFDVCGWDISNANLYQAAKRAHVLEPHLIEQLKVDLEAIVPMKAVLNPDYIASN